MTTRTGKVIVNQTVSADGYSAGHNQTEERPFGDDGGDGWGNRLHAWMLDNAEENRGEADQTTDARAYIMGRNMFGPLRGEWDRPWKGWWGHNPPFHADLRAHPPPARPAADGCGTVAPNPSRLSDRLQPANQKILERNPRGGVGSEHRCS
jgi:RibD C-terminal domain